MIFWAPADGKWVGWGGGCWTLQRLWSLSGLCLDSQPAIRHAPHAIFTTHGFITHALSPYPFSLSLSLSFPLFHPYIPLNPFPPPSHTPSQPLPISLPSLSTYPIAFFPPPLPPSPPSLSISSALPTSLAVSLPSYHTLLPIFRVFPPPPACPLSLLPLLP
jgi:hypothetical protein